MPFLIIALGLLIFVTAINGTTVKFGRQLADDTFGKGGFIYWFILIIIIGAVGYIKKLQGLSDSFLVLVVIVLFLADKGGVFSQFASAMAQIGQNEKQKIGNPSAPSTQPTATDPLGGVGSIPGTNSPGVSGGYGILPSNSYM